MGNCKSAHTIDVLCNHNKPHIAICLGINCTRDEGDRRLCEECLVDHMCTDRITIDNAIKYDQYHIKPVIEKFERDQTSSDAIGGLSQTLQNFKNNFFECLKSYQTYYDIYLNQFLLTGIPDAEMFGEAASQISEAFDKNDLGYIQKQGLQILLNTYKEPSLIKLVVGNLDASSRKLSTYLTQVELKLKKLQENFCQDLNILPQKISNDNNFMNSMFEMDSKSYNYEFSAYLTTIDTSRTCGSIIQLNCSEHNQKISVICCDRCPNKDIRLCGQCLLTHKCNAGQRIKLKSFAQDQQLIIEACKKYLKKLSDIQEVKQKVRRMFDEIMKQIIREIELVVVFVNGSMVSLDSRGVAIITYLMQHEDVKQQLLNFDVKNNAILYLNKLVVQLEELGKNFLLNISQIDDIAQFEKKPSQNLEQSLVGGKNTIGTTSVIATTPVMATTINGGNLFQTLQKQPSFQLTLKMDKDFENQIDSCPVNRVLRDFGEDQDNFVSDIVYFDKYLMVSTTEGLIVLYEGIGEKKVAEYQFQAKCTSICGLYYKNLPSIAICLGTFEQHNIGILQCQTDKLKLIGFLEGHTDPILKVKQLIRQEFLVSCSGDHTVRIWDTKQSDIMEKIKSKIIVQHKMAVRDVILICSNLLVTGSFDETLQIYDIKTDKIVYAQQFEDWIYCLQNLTDKAFVLGLGNGDIIILSTQNFNELQRVRIAPSYVNQIMIFENPNYLFVSCKNRDNYIIRLQDYRQIDYITKNEDVEYVPEGILVIQNKIIYGEGNSVKIKNAN